MWSGLIGNRLKTWLINHYGSTLLIRGSGERSKDDLFFSHVNTCQSDKKKAPARRNDLSAQTILPRCLGAPHLGPRILQVSSGSSDLDLPGVPPLLQKKPFGGNRLEVAPGQAGLSWEETGWFHCWDLEGYHHVTTDLRMAHSSLMITNIHTHDHLFKKNALITGVLW